MPEVYNLRNNPEFGGVSALKVDINVPSNGEYFLVDIGEGGKQLYQRRGNEIIGLAIKYPDDWQGKTIGQWTNELTNKAISDLGISKPQEINQADFNDWIKSSGIKQTTVNDFNQFKSGAVESTSQYSQNVQSTGGVSSTGQNAYDYLQSTGDRPAQTGGTIQTAGSQTGTTSTGSTGRQQILNVDMMKQYKPEQYERLSDGAVVLKEGVTPIAGTTKNYTGSASTGTTSSTGGNGTVTIQNANGHQLTVSQSAYDSYYSKPDSGWTKVGGGTSGGTTGSTESGTTEGTTQTFDRNTALTMLKGMGLPQTQIDMIMGIVDKFDFGDAIDNAEILKKFNEISTNVIDPYYSEMINTFKKDLEIQVARDNEDYEKVQELQKQQADAAIMSQQASLEASGMSRTGESARQLGQYSTYGSQYGEGVIPKEISRLAESSRSDYLRGVENLGRTAEKQLGSAGVSGLVSGYNPQGGITGEIPYAKEAAKAGLLGGLSGQQDLMTTYRSLYV